MNSLKNFKVIHAFVFLLAIICGILISFVVSDYKSFKLKSFDHRVAIAKAEEKKIAENKKKYAAYIANAQKYQELVKQCNLLDAKTDGADMSACNAAINFKNQYGPFEDKYKTAGVNASNEQMRIDYPGIDFTADTACMGGFHAKKLFFDVVNLYKNNTAMQYSDCSKNVKKFYLHNQEDNFPHVVSVVKTKFPYQDMDSKFDYIINVGQTEGAGNNIIKFGSVDELKEFVKELYLAPKIEGEASSINIDNYNIKDFYYFDNVLFLGHNDSNYDILGVMSNNLGSSGEPLKNLFTQEQWDDLDSQRTDLVHENYHDKYSNEQDSEEDNRIDVSE